MSRKSDENAVGCFGGCFLFAMSFLCVVTIVFNVSQVIIKVCKHLNPPPPVVEPVKESEKQPEFTIDEWIDKYNQR